MPTSPTTPTKSPSPDHAHYRLVADAIAYLREHQREQPDLASLARAMHTSESHLQRVFSSWAGVSPKRFLQIITRRYAVEALRDDASVLDASLHAGLSGPGRLHDLTLSCDAMTPGEIAGRGKGIALEYGWGDSPFGAAFVAWSDRGVCQLSFHEAKNPEVLRAFEDDWQGATRVEHSAAASALLQRIFANPLERGKLHLLLRGTNFQVKVWEALMQVAPGRLVSYQQLGALAGTGQAHRAVGSAMARNRIAYLIPCHRVIRQGGDWGNYRWGLERKLALHVWEQSA
ncbi:bifunctional helix-turn-helix domain-containing protein/methylated-DNA--[protein]-cysteine S-methyltransferase [Congregibacter litoralis]|nr:bifunctional helix-turn-helix domain-containing protein/methylated-DNA--[protein]-cysteine S-methyltransferase [Congregibacter litoralis]